MRDSGFGPALLKASLFFSLSLLMATGCQERNGPPGRGSGVASAPELAPRDPGAQVGDTTFTPNVDEPAFASGSGPRILLDEAHNNFHTMDGRYRTAVRLLEADGFRVDALRHPIGPETLANADLLLIANALADENVRSWRLPTPSAFSPKEIAAVEEWVAGGGALLLIADHMPFPGAAAELASGFGAHFLNGFATDSTGAADTFTFRRTDGTVISHPVTDGLGPEERIDSVMSFTGQAFRVDPPLETVLRVPEGTKVLMPEEAWVFTPETPVRDGEGLAQGAVGEWGQGRVAFWGEAAMFTAQVSGPERRPMGMNLPEAGQNAQLFLNLVRWLTAR
jgi:hypothetical protein